MHIYLLLRESKTQKHSPLKNRILGCKYTYNTGSLDLSHANAHKHMYSDAELYYTMAMAMH